MKEPKRPTARERTKPGPAQTDQKENAAIEPDHLLDEVQEANAQIPNAAERERVIPSRPC